MPLGMNRQVNPILGALMQQMQGQMGQMGQRPQGGGMMPPGAGPMPGAPQAQIMQPPGGAPPGLLNQFAGGAMGPMMMAAQLRKMGGAPGSAGPGQSVQSGYDQLLQQAMGSGGPGGMAGGAPGFPGSPGGYSSLMDQFSGAIPSRFQLPPQFNFMPVGGGLGG